MKKKRHLILIGMPGVGKSTLGRHLAQRLGYGYVDTDDLIEAGEGRPLKTLIGEEGLEGFCRIEARAVRSLALDRPPLVVATGGSVIYSEKAMAHLKMDGVVIFLDLDLEEVRGRAGDLHTRGVVIVPGQTLEQLWTQRRPHYLRFADRVFACGELGPAAAAAALCEDLAGSGLLAGS